MSTYFEDNINISQNVDKIISFGILARHCSPPCRHGHPGNGKRAGETMRIDATSISIISQLRDGRKSYKKIAEELGLSENTVRTRVNKLVDTGILEISGLVNPEALPHHRMVMVGVKLKTMDLVKKGEEFSKLPGVVSVSVVTGRYDLIMVVFLKEGYDLLEFYTQEVSRVEDVQSVETFVVYKNFNLMVPYIF